MNHGTIEPWNQASICWRVFSREDATLLESLWCLVRPIAATCHSEPEEGSGLHRHDLSGARDSNVVGVGLDSSVSLRMTAGGINLSEKALAEPGALKTRAFWVIGITRLVQWFPGSMVPSGVRSVERRL